MIRSLTLLALLCMLALPAAAFDLGPAAPAKNVPQVTPPPADPDVLRQGGDTIADAYAFTIPAVDVIGTTAGYTDDYDEVCPYDMSTSPDVVYFFVPDATMIIDIDMFGSSYDTKIYVYDQDLALVACNDDYYADYTSRLESLPVTGSVTYYLVIDGYGGDFGDYLLNVTEYVPCELECPPAGVLEGEPPLGDDYMDDYNGGCSSTVIPTLQPVNVPVFCGVSGWYLYAGSNYRDTDWFLMTVPAGGVLEIVGDAERPTYMFELGPQDCNEVGVLQNVEIGPCNEGYMAITGEPGADIWFWVGPTDFASPDGSDVYEYDYVLYLNLPVAVEDHSWTGVKSLFR